MKVLIQPTIFGPPEVVSWKFDKEMSNLSKELLESCKGLSDYEIEKSLRLTELYIVEELRHFFKKSDFP